MAGRKKGNRGIAKAVRPHLPPRLLRYVVRCAWDKEPGDADRVDVYVVLWAVDRYDAKDLARQVLIDRKWATSPDVHNGRVHFYTGHPMSRSRENLDPDFPTGAKVVWLDKLGVEFIPEEEPTIPPVAHPEPASEPDPGRSSWQPGTTRLPTWADLARMDDLPLPPPPSF